MRSIHNAANRRPARNNHATIRIRNRLGNRTAKRIPRLRRLHADVLIDHNRQTRTRGHTHIRWTDHRVPARRPLRPALRCPLTVPGTIARARTRAISLSIPRLTRYRWLPVHRSATRHRWLPGIRSTRRIATRCARSRHHRRRNRLCRLSWRWWLYRHRRRRAILVHRNNLLRLSRRCCLLLRLLNCRILL